MNKILVITDMYPNKYNPVAGVFVQHQVNELALRANVKVISTFFPFRKEINEAMENGVSITRIYFPVYTRLYLFSLLTYHSMIREVILRVLREWNPDIIHVHDCRHIPELFILRKLLGKTKTNQFLSVHNIRTSPERMKGNIFGFVYKRTLKYSYSGWNQVFTVNERLKTYLQSVTGTKEIVNIGNAITELNPLNKYQYPSIMHQLEKDNYKIVSVGNLVPEKGFDFLINAVHNLRASGIKIQLVIVGEGFERKRLEMLIRKLDESKNIKLLGSIGNDELRYMYQYFDLFVLPSYMETFGIAYLEAMYAGLPVIGIKGQGIDGIVTDDLNGYLVAPKSVDDLADRIKYIISHPQQSKVVADNGKNLVREKFMMNGLIDTIMRYYAN